MSLLAPFRAIYCTSGTIPHHLPHLRHHSAPSNALTTPFRTPTAALPQSFRVIYKTTDHRPHPVHPFGTGTYHPKAPHP
jgi:hypothetical protein